MGERGVRRFVADLLAGRRPRPFHAEDDDVARVRAAIALRAARPGAGTPSEEFVTGLHDRLATELARDEQANDTAPGTAPRAAVDRGRRRLVAGASIAAGAAAIGAGVDHLLTRPTADSAADPAAPTLVPDVGTWRTVAASAELPEGGVRGFDLGTVTGFVTRTGGRVGAVSGVCTHLGCRLALDPAARVLNCPCHSTSFTVDGQLLRYQLPTPPAALPHFTVREVDGVVQVYAPPIPEA
jgi:cytochrome b6-f complex iron-sulfur subunit